MRLFKTDMCRPVSPIPAISTSTARLRYGGRGPRRTRVLDDQPECGAEICQLLPSAMTAADIRSCPCRDRGAVEPANDALDRAA